MIRRSSVRFVPALLLALSLVLSACSSSKPAAPAPEAKPTAPAPAPEAKPAQPAAAKKVRLTTGVDPTYAPWFVAHEKGFFKKYGLESDLKQFPAGNLGVEQIVAGQADFGGTTPFTPMNLNEKGADIVAVAMHTDAPSTLKLVAKADVKSVQDLKGKTIGYQKGSIAEFLWKKVLTQNNLKAEDVKMVPVAATETLAVFQKGDIDAFILWEPFPSKAIEMMKDKAKILGNSSQVAKYSAKLYAVTSAKYADANPDVIENVLKALNDANAFFKSNTKEAVDITAKWTKWDAAQVESFLKDSTYALALADDNKTDWNEQFDWFKSQGVLKTAPDFSKVYRPQYLQKVQPNAVKLSK